MAKHPSQSKAALEAAERGGWLTPRALSNYIYDVLAFSKAEGEAIRFAWMDNHGLHHCGGALPENWTNPYWEIIQGHMVMRCGPDIVNDDPLPSVEELERKIAEARAKRQADAQNATP